MVCAVVLLVSLAGISSALFLLEIWQDCNTSDVCVQSQTGNVLRVLVDSFFPCQGKHEDIFCLM